MSRGDKLPNVVKLLEEENGCGESRNDLGESSDENVTFADGDKAPQLKNGSTQDFQGRAGPEGCHIKEDAKGSPSALYHVSSSFSRRGPLWPQTFERQMGIYSRSSSGRNFTDSCEIDYTDAQGKNLPSTPKAFGSPTSPVVLNSQWKDPLKEPLLRKSNSHGSGQITNNGRILFPSKEHEQCHVANESGAIEEPEHQVFDEGSSFLQACLNGTNVLAGVGILSTPYALAEGGWISLIFLLLFALICGYTGILLRKCLDTDPSINTYPDIGQAAFGRKGRILVSIMLYFELYCVTVEFLILEGDNLANLFPFEDITIGGSSFTPHQIYIIASGICFMPTVWLRDLSLLSYISAGGVVAVLAIVSTVGYVGAFEGVGFHNSGSFMNVSGLPVAVGISAFCFCGHAVFPSIYRSMKHKESFSKVLVVCFTIVTIIYGGIGTMGYMMFGDDLESQVTLNLPRTLISSRIAIWITLVNPFAKFALTITPLAVALEEFLPSPPKSKQFMASSMCIRNLLVFSTIIMALAIPFFGLMMAFIGSFLSTTVAIILPCLCYLRIYGRAGGISSGEGSVLVVVLFIGIITAFVGTYSAVRSIVGNINDSK